MATIKGKWVFNDEVSLAAGGTALSQSVNFTSNGANYSLVNLTHLDGFGTPLLYYGNTLVFDLMGREQGFERWRDEVYRYVDFGETEQDVSDAFRTYMDTNATPEAEPTPTDAITIEYNGSVIASLKAGQSATLPCKDKPMLSDVVVSVPEGLGGSVEEWDGSYTVSGGTISFTITGTSYEAEDGMTWEQWVSSEYNTSGYVIDGGFICPRGGHLGGWVKDGYTLVTPTDTIVEGREYDIEPFSSGGSNE